MTQNSLCMIQKRTTVTLLKPVNMLSMRHNYDFSNESNYDSIRKQ